MAFKTFLQNLFERVGLAEAPLPPPAAGDVTLAEPDEMRPILRRLAAWGIMKVHLAARDAPNAGELTETLGLAAELGIKVSIRGRASDLYSAKLLAALSDAGVTEIEIPILSAIAEVHDALAGMGDYRCVQQMLDALAEVKLAAAAQVVLTPSTWKTIERTLEMLDDRRVRAVRIWAIVCRDDEPASWALSAGELVKAVARLESRAQSEVKFDWYPPLKFDPSRTLAQQVRGGPRATFDAIRVEPDGSIIRPLGTSVAGGNVSENDWKLIARSEPMRDWKRRRAAVVKCEACPRLAVCERGCLRDEGNWADR